MILVQKIYIILQEKKYTTGLMNFLHFFLKKTYMLWSVPE